MNKLYPQGNRWLAQVQEEIIDPDRPIIDPHHHLWKNGLGFDYLLDELWQDTESGHNIEKTVFIECHAFYDREKPRHLCSTGETKAIAGIAKESHLNNTGNAKIAGLISHVDLRLAGNAEELLREAITLHQTESDGLLRGFRHSGAFDKNPDQFFITPRAPSHLYGKKSFRKGLRILADLSLSYDTWHYHCQNEEFFDLARAIPECTMILDHFGTPLGVGNYAGCRDEIFHQWQQDIKDISRCENVYAKLGGLAMPDNGFGWHQRDLPPDSDEFVEEQQRYYLHTIECFGPERCMFESNFPVDRFSLSYHVVWNGFKKMVADFSEADKHAMFYGTAEKVYRLTD